jgi:hypothetical protein
MTDGDGQLKSTAEMKQVKMIFQSKYAERIQNLISDKKKK